jgi:hypothetical protein
MVFADGLCMYLKKNQEMLVWSKPNSAGFDVVSSFSRKGRRATLVASVYCKWKTLFAPWECDEVYQIKA